MFGLTTEQWLLPAAALAVGVGLAISPAEAQAATVARPVKPAVRSTFGLPCDWLLESAATPKECLTTRTQIKQAVVETKAQLVSSGEAEPDSRVLGRHGRLGDVAAPVERFRDGGHAYYLFGGGLHSCTYTGKCMDLFAPIGEPVYAFADGKLVRKPYAGGSYGKYVEIRHRDKSISIYAHLNRIVAHSGPVKAGDLIGFVGCSGTSGEFNGCVGAESHLHFEWSGLHWSEGQYGELPPYFREWRGKPKKCYQGC